MTARRDELRVCCFCGGSVNSLDAVTLTATSDLMEPARQVLFAHKEHLQRSCTLLCRCTRICSKIEVYREANRDLEPWGEREVGGWKRERIRLARPEGRSGRISG